MSLFEEASLVITPNGFKAGKLYAVKGADLDVTRATSATRVNANGVIETMGANVPRIDYSGGGCPSILVEPQRTNLLTYSNDFSNAAWSKVLTNIDSSTVISPDGTSNGFLLNFSTGGYITSSAITLGNTPITISVFAKSGSISTFKIQEAFYFGTICNFDLVAKTAGSGGKIEEYDNGWFKCSFTYTLGIGQLSSVFLIGQNSSIGTLNLFGAQLEAGSYATSYIPTTSASVTRNADVISKTGISSLIGQTEGVVFADFVYNASSTQVGNLINFNTSTTSSIFIVRLASGVVDVGIFESNVVKAQITLGSIPIGTRIKLAYAYKSGDSALYINGVQVGISSDTYTTPLNLTEINLNDDTAYFAFQQDVSFNAVALWKTRLTNAELAELTTL